MKNKIGRYLLFLITCLILSACSGGDDNSNVVLINYNFEEPTTFLFVVDDMSTEIDIPIVDYLHQFSFKYRNKQPTQQINYILSKVFDEPKSNKVPDDVQTEYKLENGLSAFYEEDARAQTLWWENEDGFLARFVYFIHGNTKELGEYKLDPEELVELANQVH